MVQASDYIYEYKKTDKIVNTSKTSSKIKEDITYFGPNLPFSMKICIHKSVSAVVKNSQIKKI